MVPHAAAIAGDCLSLHEIRSAKIVQADFVGWCCGDASGGAATGGTGWLASNPEASAEAVAFPIAPLPELP